MVGDPYDAPDDPACYPGTHVLINLADIRDQVELDEYEIRRVGLRSFDLPAFATFEPAEYRALHRHLFGDVYSWAGEYRKIRTGKGGSWFAFPEYIHGEMDRLFKRLVDPAYLPGSDPDQFIVRTADFLADLNAIHPFREGNGRTQLIFLRQLGLRAGHPFRTEAIEADEFLAAMIESFHGRMEALVDELERMRA
jgi:cell filamentation protein